LPYFTPAQGRGLPARDRAGPRSASWKGRTGRGHAPRSRRRPASRSHWPPITSARWMSCCAPAWPRRPAPAPRAWPTPPISPGPDRYPCSTRAPATSSTCSARAAASSSPASKSGCRPRGAALRGPGRRGLRRPDHHVHPGPARAHAIYVTILGFAVASVLTSPVPTEREIREFTRGILGRYHLLDPEGKERL